MGHTTSIGLLARRLPTRAFTDISSCQNSAKNYKELYINVIISKIHNNNSSGAIGHLYLPLITFYATKI
jgi:hypothetical protein